MLSRCSRFQTRVRMTTQSTDSRVLRKNGGPGRATRRTVTPRTKQSELPEYNRSSMPKPCSMAQQSFRSKGAAYSAMLAGILGNRHMVTCMTQLPNPSQNHKRQMQFTQEVLRHDLAFPHSSPSPVDRRCGDLDQNHGLDIFKLGSGLGLVPRPCIPSLGTLR